MGLACADCLPHRLGDMTPASHFKYCPACGTARRGNRETQPMVCGKCGFTFYFNTTCATAAFIVRPDGKALFIRREKEPAKGKLAIPGGFVDFGETAEDGLRREFREEVGIRVKELTFLCSHPNLYLYKDVTYRVLDFFFIASCGQSAKAKALDAVASVEWLDPATVDVSELAFPSMKFALKAYLAKLAGKPLPKHKPETV